MKHLRSLAFLILATSLLTGLPVLAAVQGEVDAESHFNAGIVHLREGRAKLALDEFKQAIKQDKKNPYFYKGLGLAYAQLNEFKDAAKAFEKALDLNPYYTDVRNDLGTVLMLRGKREEGKQEFLAAFNDPTNPTPEIAARNLGRAFLEEKNYAQALSWFRTSLNRNSTYDDAHLGVADTLVALGRLDEAITQLEVAVGPMPKSAALQGALGTALYRAGRFTEARTHLEQAARLDPAGPNGLGAVQLLKNFPK